MPQQITTAVENNFTKGLITEFTGLNFPENAATDTDNCEYTLIGDVLRRLGIDIEENYGAFSSPTSAQAFSVYKWNNAGGDSITQVIVVQLGSTLRFYLSSAATDSSPISTHLLASSIDLTPYVPGGGTFDITQECTYADGNGYLFVFNPGCEPLYCNYNAGVVTATNISINVRDFLGIPELNSQVNFRPTTLSSVHKYNLGNQGWTTKSAWGASTAPTTNQVSGPGSKTFFVGTVTGITLGDTVYGYSNAVFSGFPGETSPIYGSGYVTFGGSVTAYSDPYITINITSVNNPSGPSLSFDINQSNQGFIDAWHAAEGNYPSNADVWWYFKNASGAFDPATTQPNISLSAGNAPQGHYILSAFNQDRGSVSGIAGLGTVSTNVRPSNGVWFQGRIWYTGVKASRQSDTVNPFYSWSENIYFSQVNVGTAVNFGNCYQTNDPTSENLFDLLPTDGGVIQIQGSGNIYKLFSIQNGLLVFAANGVWFITGSQGIGFAANDYTITKISSIESISSTSFVDVKGLPYFWNEEGIYSVQPQQQGGLTVEDITVGTIKQFYNDIPKQSKKFVRGAYHPIDYNIQWIYKSEEETDVADRYSFDRILNFNTYNKAFFPYSVSNEEAAIRGIVYLQGPGGSNSPEPVLKYFSSWPGSVDTNFSFAEERNEHYVDWESIGFTSNYVSSFITGYKIRGQGIRKFQPQYVQIWSRLQGLGGYKIRGIWDYAANSIPGRYTQFQYIEVNDTNYKNMYRRHKIRGQGYSLQLEINSIDGKPFDLIGWAIIDTVNQGT